MLVGSAEKHPIPRKPGCEPTQHFLLLPLLLRVHVCAHVSCMCVCMRLCVCVHACACAFLLEKDSFVYYGYNLDFWVERDSRTLEPGAKNLIFISDLSISGLQRPRGLTADALCLLPQLPLGKPTKASSSRT